LFGVFVGRFHVLAEFDESKRSCRKRLADHNRRRRKPQNNNSADKTKHNAPRPSRDSCNSTTPNPDNSKKYTWQERFHV